MRTNDEIIEIVTELKDAKGWSLNELGRRLGIAKSSMSRYFNKTRGFPLNKAHDFAKVLGVSTEYILGFDLQGNKVDNPQHTSIPNTVINQKTTPTITKIVEVTEKLKIERQEKVLSYSTAQLEAQKLESPENVVKFTHDKATHSIDESVIEYVSLDFAMGGAVAGLGNYHDGYEMDKIKIPSSAVPYGTDFGILVDGDSMSPTYPNGSIALVKSTVNVDIGDIGIFKQDTDVWIKEAGQGKLISHNRDYPDIIVSDDSEPIMVIGRVLGYWVEKY